MKVKIPETAERSIGAEQHSGAVLALWFGVLCFALLVHLPNSACLAVTSKVVRQASGEVLLKGQVEDVIVGSRGTIELGRAAEVLIDRFEDTAHDPNKKESLSEPWAVNSIVASGGVIYIGTSPDGGIYKYSLGKITKIYSAEPEEEPNDVQAGNEQSNEGEARGPSEPNDVNEPARDANEPTGQAVQAERHLANEHIFAMASDVSGRLLAGISGKKASLCRLEAGQIKVIYEPNDAKYIFAIVVGDDGDIFLGTGPQGKVYRLNSFGEKPALIYDSTDKNILSLAVGRDGFIYAGSDTRGLVYKIDPKAAKATVLYDSDQEEVTALLFAGQADDSYLYAAATSAKILRAQQKFAAQRRIRERPGRPLRSPESRRQDKGGRKLQIANTKKKVDEGPPEMPPPPVKLIPPGKASFIYQVSRDGFVTEVFSEPAVLFSMAEQQGKLFVGTGNDGQLFAVEPVLEEEAIIYDDKRASQITVVVSAGEDVYLGTANPAKLIKLGRGFASEGTYTSDLIDAGQPARWGKLQIDADIPQGCKVMMASRSGNVKDVNDPTFSAWTESIEVTGPVELACPLGRFCQYKLTLQSGDQQNSPLIREVAVAHIIPNLAPKVEEVTVSRIETPEKMGMFKISYKSKDDNNDKLIYKIDFRRLDRSNWIELEDKIEKDSFEWDGRTVEDGRYEIRVTANDERSNTTKTKLTGARISEPAVVDNTGPVIKDHQLKKNGTTLTLKLKVADELSAIGRLHYTVDSNAEWISTIPDDLVYDTTEEDFTIVIEDLEAGEHIISVRIKDDIGNTTYKTFEVN